VRQDDRAPFDRALLRARRAAYPAGEFVGQESFMTAGEIRALAQRAGIGPQTAVLDLCCGIAGPGRFVTRELGGAYLGVDASAGAVAIARAQAAAEGLPCTFAVAEIPPVPHGPFDVVVLLETMLEIPDKDALAAGIGAALRPGGRFAFTLEAGAPFTAAERAAMPDSDTLSLTPLEEIEGALARAGLAITWSEDHSRAHLATARALAGAYAADGDAIAAQVGRQGLEDLLTAHGLWIDWFATGRVRKLALVAERRDGAKPDAVGAPVRDGRAANSV
jgi:sarcosine/dimethylglycine N-methyltransferase